MAREVKAGEVELVWDEWQKRQRRPDLVRLTDERRKLIRARLALGYTTPELVALVRFAYESSDRRARFWRGENEDKKTFLDLENLLRVTKLGDRIPVAVEWAERGEPGAGAAGAVPTGAGLVLKPGARTRSAR